jgi:UDP-N-acetylglucosamine 2-epimerase (non-hydrolysing)
MKSVCIVAGTRPEIIKLAPVHKELCQRASFSTIWLSTGQHTQLAEQTREAFGIDPDVMLRLPEAPVPSLSPPSVARLFSTLMQQIDEQLARLAPSLVIVQGDTTSAVAAGVAAYSRQIPVAHVEAGLRTFDLARPFPEEGWRSVLSQICTLHFAPTNSAAENLLRCGVAERQIRITGNTVIDALHWLLGHTQTEEPIPETPARRRVLVTLHRRENWQSAFPSVCAALIQLRDRIADIEICFVHHANPALRRQAEQNLAGQERIRLLEPMAYPAFIRLLEKATLVLSDSGGVQEEAPALGVPVLVLRDSTERQEAVDEGVAKLVGTNSGRILNAAIPLLADPQARQRMARRVDLFGDGNAARRIADSIESFLATGAAAVSKTAA